MKVGLAFAAAMAATVFSLGQARAAEMIFSETTTTSGSLNGVAFSNKLITLTGEADTSDIYSPSAGVYRDNLQLTLIIQGVGTAHLTDEMFVASNQNSSIVGFLDPTPNTGSLFTAKIDNAGYDLSAPFGPVTGEAGIGTSLNYATDQGVFSLVGPPRSTTYEAVLAPVPEPSTWLMMTGGLGMLGVTLRRRRTLVTA